MYDAKRATLGPSFICIFLRKITSSRLFRDSRIPAYPS